MLLQFVFNLILTPFLLVFEILCAFFECLQIYIYRFALLFCQDDSNFSNSQTKRKIHLVIVTLPVAIITTLEFIVFLVEHIIAKIIFTLQKLLPIISFLSALIGIITFGLVYAFSFVQYYLIFSENRKYLVTHVVEAHPITQSYKNTK